MYRVSILVDLDKDPLLLFDGLLVPLLEMGGERASLNG